MVILWSQFNILEESIGYKDKDTTIAVKDLHGTAFTPAHPPVNLESRQANCGTPISYDISFSPYFLTHKIPDTISSDSTFLFPPTSQLEQDKPPLKKCSLSPTVFYDTSLLKRTTIRFTPRDSI